MSRVNYQQFGLYRRKDYVTPRSMREVEEAHGIKDYSDAHGPDWTERDEEYLR